jgi:membrane-bound ClpP family serine protease
MIFPLSSLLLIGATLACISLLIWWPRRAAAGSLQASTYGTIKGAALLQLLGFVLLLAPVLDPRDGFFMLLVIVAAIVAAVLLIPQALGALALDIGNRRLGVAGSFLAVLFACGITLLCFSNALGYLLLPELHSTWRCIVSALGALLSGGAVLLSMEVYLAFRHPPGMDPLD